MLPLLAEVLTIDYTVDGVIAQIRVHLLHERVLLLGSERAVSVQQIHDRLGEDRMHRTAGEPGTNQRLVSGPQG